MPYGSNPSASKPSSSLSTRAAMSSSASAAHFTSGDAEQGSVLDGDAALYILRMLQLVEQRDGEVLRGDAAPALFVAGQLIAAGAVFSCPRARLDQRRRA